MKIIASSRCRLQLKQLTGYLEMSILLTNNLVQCIAEHNAGSQNSIKNRAQTIENRAQIIENRQFGLVEYIQAQNRSKVQIW